MRGHFLCDPNCVYAEQRARYTDRSLEWTAYLHSAGPPWRGAATSLPIAQLQLSGAAEARNCARSAAVLTAQGLLHGDGVPSSLFYRPSRERSVHLMLSVELVGECDARKGSEIKSQYVCQKSNETQAKIRTTGRAVNPSLALASGKFYT
jgi:hypothetical protein